MPSGSVWFFNPENTEMLVEVQDACAPTFNRFWVFYAATTNVEFQVKVTDTESEEVWERHNPQGTVAPPVADTQAFATCPEACPGRPRHRSKKKPDRKDRAM